jgi:hypothetical protein
MMKRKKKWDDLIAAYGLTVDRQAPHLAVACMPPLTYGARNNLEVVRKPSVGSENTLFSSADFVHNRFSERDLIACTLRTSF